MTVDPADVAAAMLDSRRYRAVDPGFVRAIAAAEASNRPDLAAAIKATKRRLHQATGAFWRKRPRYRAWLTELVDAWETGSEAEVRAAAAGMMRWHASTAERLPIVEAFYRQAFAGLGPVTSVLDLGCGLNPLAAPWMGLAAGARYHACDVDGDMVGFVGDWLRLAGLAGEVGTCNLLGGAPDVAADVVLMLKLVPSLEAHDPDAPARLLAGVAAPAVVVSYPTGNLSPVRYASFSHDHRLIEEAAAGGWSVRSHRFASEAVFVLTR